MIVPHRFSFYYEQIVRQDLLLKLNGASIMQIPRVEKIVVVSPVANDSVQNMILALESLCGQRCLESEHVSPSNKIRVKKAFSFKKAQGALMSNSQIHTCLRKQPMYHFLDKLLMLISFHHCTTQFYLRSIQLTINTNLLRLFPEIQNHFEWFENVHTLRITIVTSAKTETETRLLWTGLLQKEM